MYKIRIDHLDLKQTAESGQCFRFRQKKDDMWSVTAFGKYVEITQDGDEFTFSCDKDEFCDIWAFYFDLDTDYALVEKLIKTSDDFHLKEAYKRGSGIRILRQNLWETIVTFIISQNKQIGHIKKIVADISAKYGNDLGEIARVKTYAFPTPFQMKDVTCEDLSKLKTGFRAGYIKDAIDRVIGKEFSKDYLDESFKEHFAGVSGDEAITELTKIKGVGLKVASCVALFSLGKRESFPVDVWIKRIMQDKYFDGKDTKIPDIKAFADERFGDLGGYAQQYLFYYARSLKSKK